MKYEDAKPFGLKLISGLSIFSGIIGISIIIWDPYHLIQKKDFISQAFPFLFCVFQIWWGYAFLSLQKSAWKIGIILYSIPIVRIVIFLLNNFSRIDSADISIKIAISIIFFICLIILGYVICLKNYFEK